MSRVKKIIGAVTTSIGVAVSLITGAIMMGNYCPTVLESVKDGPQAVTTITQICSMFFQTAPHLVPSP